MTTAITLLHPDSQRFLLNKEQTTKFCDTLLQAVGKTEFALSVVLVDDNKIREMNLCYRQKDSATNVLSFPFADGAEPALVSLPVYELGDIIISLDTAAREAREYSVSFSHRLCWLIIHGLLHLCGMDHERSPQEAEEMAAREQQLLQHYRQELCNE